MFQSLLGSSLRSFLVAFFGMIGLCLAILPILLIFAIIADLGDAEIDRDYNVEVLPNADGTRKVLSKSAPVVLTLNVEGIIGTEELNMTTVRQKLTESREGSLKNDRVKAVLIRINSPGGTVADADAIYHSIKSYKEKHNVPVYAYVDGLCASGGMYIASAADKVFASEVSLIGSVGVISPPFVNISDTIEKLGMKAKTLIAGKGKDEMNPLRPWREGEDKPIQDIIDYYYKHFVHVVTSNRPRMNKEKLINDYGAHVFPAPQAKEYGYIDESGVNLSDALRLLTKEIGIEDNFYQVIQLEDRSWVTKVFKAEFPITDGKVRHQFQLSDLDPKLSNQFLYLYRPTY